MTRDLLLPVEIVVCPTVREPDGLAMSSRNVYLSPTERQQALSLSKALNWAREQIAAGRRDVRGTPDGDAETESSRPARARSTTSR